MHQVKLVKDLRLADVVHRNGVNYKVTGLRNLGDSTVEIKSVVYQPETERPPCARELLVFQTCLPLDDRVEVWPSELLR